MKTNAGLIKLRRSRGFTLTEIIIAMVLAIIIMSTIIMIFSFGRRAYDYASYSYSINQDTYAAINWIGKEMTQTNLSSIMVYPNKINAAENSGFSFISASDPDKGGFQFSNYGTPRWNRFVYYTLVPDSKKPAKKGLPMTGTLYRWVQPIDKPWAFPMSTSVLPSDDLQKDKVANRRAILRNVVLPGQDLNNDKKVDEYEGFRVLFVRLKKAGSTQEIFSATNPMFVTDDDSDKKYNDTGGSNDDFNTSTNTRMIQVNLTIMEMSKATGEPNYFMVKFRLAPLN